MKKNKTIDEVVSWFLGILVGLCGAIIGLLISIIAPPYISYLAIRAHVECLTLDELIERENRKLDNEH